MNKYWVLINSHLKQQLLQEKSQHLLFEGLNHYTHYSFKYLEQLLVRCIECILKYKNFFYTKTVRMYSLNKAKRNIIE